MRAIEIRAGTHHVDSITDQTQTIRPDAPQELNKHVREVEKKKVEDLAGFG